MTQYDVIVVGAGVIGLSTAYHLGRKGCKCLVLEQFPIFHTRGSSYGHSRLSKISHLNDFMSELLPEAQNTWKDLEKRSGTKLLVNQGHLAICHDSVKQKIAILRDRLEKQKLSYQIFKGREINQRFPGLNFNEEFTAMYEPNGMVLKADKCLRVLKEEFLKSGGDLHDEEKVLKILPQNENKVIVETSKQTYSGKSVVLACGPWINTLLKDLNATTTSQPVRVVAYFWKETKPNIYSVINQFPPLMLHFKEYHLYSTPSMEYPGLIKICYHHRSPVDPNYPNRVSQHDEILEQNRLQFLKILIQDHFTHLEEVPVITETYLQTITPSLNPVADRLPRFRNVIVAGGFSGRGFGVAPEFGRILANLASSKTEQTYSPKLAFSNYSNSRL